MNEIVKKYYKKHWRLISIQIAALIDATNPKRAFLFDCTRVDETKLSSLIANLRNENFVTNDITLVLAHSDYFIVNRAKFHETLTTSIFIDISGECSSPRLLASSEAIQRNLVDIQKAILSHESDELLRLELDEAHSPPTIFGFLINYPILYYHQQAHEANCLSHKNLKVFHVTTCNQLLMSFSVPESLFNQCEHIRKSIETFLAHYEHSGEHVVESFIANYPDVVL